MTETSEVFEGWAILELMGHRTLAGHVRQQEVGGAVFLRIDVPDIDGEIVATQFYSPAAVYCLTPTTEEIARSVASRHRPEPVQLWEAMPRAARSFAAVGAGELAELPEDDVDRDDAAGGIPF